MKRKYTTQDFTALADSGLPPRNIKLGEDAHTLTMKIELETPMQGWKMKYADNGEFTGLIMSADGGMQICDTGCAFWHNLLAATAQSGNKELAALAVAKKS